MLVPVKCECGKSFRVREERIGQKGRCPSCGMLLTIPSPVEQDQSSQSTFIPELSLDLRPKTPAKLSLGFPRPFWKDPVFQWGSIVPALVLGWFGYYLYNQHSITNQRDRIVEMQVEADATFNIDPESSYSKYSQIIDSIGAAGSHDAVTQTVFESATRKRTQLWPEVKKRADARLAIEERKRLAKQEADKITAELAGLSSFRADVTGTFVMENGLGGSKPLRGAEVYLLPEFTPKKSLANAIRALGSRKGSLAQEAFTNFSIYDDDRPIPLGRFWATLIHTQPGFQDKIDSIAYRALVEEPVWPTLLESLSIQRCETSNDGSYRFKGVNGGRYFIYCESTNDQSVIIWAFPIIINKDQNVTKDFNNNNAEYIQNNSIFEFK